MQTKIGGLALDRNVVGLVGTAIADDFDTRDAGRRVAEYLTHQARQAQARRFREIFRTRKTLSNMSITVGVPAE